MTRPRPEADDDARKAYELGIASRREQCVRSKQVAPHKGDAREARWAAEGPVPPSKLETVRDGR